MYKEPVQRAICVQKRTHTEAKTTETKMTQLRDSKRSAADDDAPAGRYYPAAGMWRLPGAVPRRRRRATVLQGARLRRVRERGRGDRHVPVLRRGPVAAAAAAGGGLLERRGDRARAVAEVGVSKGNNSKLKTSPAGGGAYLCESFSSP